MIPSSRPRAVGSGSTWSSDGPLSVGHGGNGTLAVTGGASVSNEEGYVGYSPGSAGVVTVDGDGSTWTNSGSLYVGGSDTALGGSGQLTVSDGALLAVGEALELWAGGTVNLGGGSLVADTLNTFAGGTFNFAGGELHVGTFLGDLVSDGGAICPGGSIGVMDVYGNLILNAGSIDIELAGCGAGAVCDEVVIALDVYYRPAPYPRCGGLSPLQNDPVLRSAGTRQL